MRRSWRVMSAIALLVASASMFLSVVLYTRVQASRRDVCESTNMRHDETIRVLDERMKRLPPARRARAAESRAFTVALIDALAPKRDCAKYLKPPPKR